MSKEPRPADQAAAVAEQDRHVRAAAEQLRKEAVERNRIALLKAAIEPLTRIKPPGPEYGGVYRMTRAGQEMTLTAEHLERACVVYADPLATTDDCLAVVRILARMPYDYVVEDKEAPLFTFPDLQGKPLDVNSMMILTARALVRD